MQAPANPLVHLELRTGNLPRALAFYTRLFDWRPESVSVDGNGPYLSLDLGNAIEGGVAEAETEQPIWLPYIEVADIAGATERARQLGAEVPLEPREGPAGWRSIVTGPAGAEVAMWQRKR